VKGIVTTPPQEQRHQALPVMRLLAYELHIFGTNFRSYKNELCLPTKEPPASLLNGNALEVAAVYW